MGASMKHKILSAILILMSAVSAFANSSSQLEASACTSCDLAGLATNKVLLNKVNIFLVKQKDQRHEQARTGMWGAIGQVAYIPEDQRNLPIDQQHEIPLSGVVVSPCVILTSKHAGIDESRGETYSDGKSHDITFSVGQKQNGQPKYVVKASPWRLAPNDMAYFRLADKDCVGEDPEIGYIEISNKPLLPMTVVTVAGFPQDRKFGTLIRQDRCTIYGQSPLNSALASDCSAVGASSGSPAIVFDQFGKPSVVGIVQGAAEVSSAPLNAYDAKYATLITDVEANSEYFQASKNISMFDTLQYDAQAHGNPQHVIRTSEVIPTGNLPTI